MEQATENEDALERGWLGGRLNRKLWLLTTSILPASRRDFYGCASHARRSVAHTGLGGGRKEPPTDWRAASPFVPRKMATFQEALLSAGTGSQFEVSPVKVES